MQNNTIRYFVESQAGDIVGGPYSELAPSSTPQPARSRPSTATRSPKGINTWTIQNKPWRRMPRRSRWPNSPSRHSGRLA